MVASLAGGVTALRWASVRNKTMRVMSQKMRCAHLFKSSHLQQSHFQWYLQLKRESKRNVHLSESIQAVPKPCPFKVCDFEIMDECLVYRVYFTTRQRWWKRHTRS